MISKDVVILRSIRSWLYESCFIIRDHVDTFVTRCRSLNDMKKTCGFADFTALMDWSDEELQELGRLNVEYSGVPIMYDDAPEPTQDEMSVDKISREFDKLEDYNAPEKKCSTSWATAAVRAAEAALNYRVELSEEQLFTCLPKDLGFADGCDGIHPKKVIDYLNEEGLVAKDDFNGCDKLDGIRKYHFTPNTPEVPTAGGLMNLLVTENKPVFVMMAVDIKKLTFVKNMTDVKDSVKCGGYQPSLYGVLTGYKYYSNSQSGWWEVVTNVIPGEEIVMKIPITSNMANANYAGIAAYAFTLTEVLACEDDLVISTEDDCNQFDSINHLRSITVNEGMCNSMTSDLVIANAFCLKEFIVKKNALNNLNSLTIDSNNKLVKIETENGVYDSSAPQGEKDIGAFLNVKTVVIKSRMIID